MCSGACLSLFGMHAVVADLKDGGKPSGQPAADIPDVQEEPVPAATVAPIATSDQPQQQGSRGAPASATHELTK